MNRGSGISKNKNMINFFSFNGNGTCQLEKVLKSSSDDKILHANNL